LIGVAFASGLQLSGAIEKPLGWALIALAVLGSALYVFLEHRHRERRDTEKVPLKLPAEESLKRWRAEKERDKAQHERDLFTERERDKRRLAIRMARRN
jgi:hypothetical protein